MTRRSSPAPAGDWMGLPEAAALLAVHYMTVYRYVRTGRLAARSVGGRWEVRRTDVLALQRPSGGPRSPGRSATSASLMFERRVVDADEAGAFAVCEAALGSWAQPADVYTEVVGPAMRRIGIKWSEGTLTVSAEHRATAVVTRVIGRLGPQFVPPGRTRGTVVVGAPAGDLHSLPVAMVADLIRAEHLGVVDLGADTPPESFVEAARQADRIVAVAIGATLPDNDRAIAATVRHFRREAPGVAVIIGGSGVPSAAAARRLGADRWTEGDGRSVAALLSELSGGDPRGITPPRAAS